MRPVVDRIICLLLVGLSVLIVASERRRARRARA